MAEALRFCGRCGKEECGATCPLWTVPSDRRIGTVYVGESVYGNGHIFLTDDDGQVVGIRREDAFALAMALLALVGKAAAA